MLKIGLSLGPDVRWTRTPQLCWRRPVVSGVVERWFVLASSVFSSLKNQSNESTGKAKLISMKRRPLGSLPRCMMGTALQSLSNREENLTWSLTESILES